MISLLLAIVTNDLRLVFKIDSLLQDLKDFKESFRKKNLNTLQKKKRAYFSKYSILLLKLSIANSIIE